LQIPHARGANFGIDDRDRAATEIDGRQSESFVHGHDKVTSTQNALAISQSTIENFTQRNANILDGVVLIHIQITHRRELQIESAVPREELQHVVKETNSRRNLILSAAFNRERNPNLGFRGLAM
jgi:hypothetical protein